MNLAPVNLNSSLNLHQHIGAFKPDADIFGQPASAWLNSVAQLNAQLVKHPQKKWLLFDESAANFSVMFFALLTSQKQIVLPPSDRPNQLLALKPHVDATLGSASIDGLPHLSGDPIDQGTAQNTNIQSNPAPLIIMPEQTIEFFTSGSTSEAKKISKSWSLLNNEINALDALWSESLANAQVVSTVSHQHIYGLIFTVLWPVLAGRQIHQQFIRFPEELNLLLSQQLKPITLISSPAFLTRTCNEPLYQNHTSRFNSVYSSGGPLPLDTALAIQQQLGHSPIEVFGSTETGGIAWRRQTDRLTATLWQPFADIHIRATAEQRLEIQSPYLPQELPQERPQELPQQLSQQGAQKDWYTTDDRVIISPQGLFELLRRADRIVKIEQKRLSLDTLEATLSEHPWVQQCRSLVVSGKREQIAVAVVLTEQGQSHYQQHNKRHINQQLRQHLANHFEAVLLPRKWRYVSTLPVNSQGKVVHQDLMRLFEGSTE
ncbi:MAG: acyl-coenzyme A synthetase/AMP-(fatty) acid ligase [Phenylobacterium sp.]|jgi:acyl-coenzyme A synthetase/AMP-(fatty) acid ligase